MKQNKHKIILVVQIPCLNEEKTLPLVLKTIPKKIPGVDKIEVLVIDDGSTDKTVQVAQKYGVKHFVRHSRNMGLARSFHDGIYKALDLHADIIVNTDGDNQYPQAKIADLIQPILAGKADIVVADRQTQEIAHFSPTKKLLQKWGTRIVNAAAGTNVPDAPSGFRAYSKRAAMMLNTITKFSYTMETIIQAGNKRLAIASVPIETNPKLRESRLFKSSREHVYKSSIAILRSYIMYKPYIIFNTLGTIFLIVGLIPFIRYGILLLSGDKGNHLQSLILGAVLLIGAFLSFVLSIVTDLIRINRILIEDSLEQIKRQRFE